MSPSSSPAPSPTAVSSPSPNSNHPTLPPLITSPTSSRASAIPPPMSHASKNRLSQYSVGSVPSRSRPPSYLFPIFHSSLTYTIVRDFAYPPIHPMHYGPPPEGSRPASGMTTPASETRRLSDPPTSWEWTTDGGLGKGERLAPIHFGDGPPWSEDEDLQSPVVSSRHKKHKSSSASLGHHKSRSAQEHGTLGAASMMSPDRYERQRGYFTGTGSTGDGSERYYVSQEERPMGLVGTQEQKPRHYMEHESGYKSESDVSSTASSPGFRPYDESRYSRDYQFTITSPDEEMHGKAVALFDFERENENELPLVEGQIIWVSYRHGQGWLVAEDPKTQESGLVPEEYVRLLRDIEGGMNSLTGDLGAAAGTPNDTGTPTQAEHVVPSTAAATATGGTSSNSSSGHAPTQSTSSTNGYHQPVVSTFSTSSKDLDPYPPHLLGSQAGQPPPQVVHYHGQRGGSQANTPTAQSSFDSGMGRRGSQDTIGRSDSSSRKSQPLEILPDKKLASPVEEASSELDQEQDKGPTER
ncbi:NAP1-binding protein [Apiospora phragmitis]|uniref:NAP1-binding protein n=1 Tax=Apiospora phragmitis TaxID=2905665 RepID=A0ABR1ULQ4_9PEZI